MSERRPKRPRDPAQLAKLIVDIATGEADVQRTKTKTPLPLSGGGKVV
jgi:hypothetical protein